MQLISVVPEIELSDVEIPANVLKAEPITEMKTSSETKTPETIHGIHVPCNLALQWFSTASFYPLPQIHLVKRNFRVSRSGIAFDNKALCFLTNLRATVSLLFETPPPRQARQNTFDGIMIIERSFVHFPTEI